MKKWFLLMMTLGALALQGCDHSGSKNMTQWPATEKCDLNKGRCIAQQGDVKVSLSVAPQPIPVARPLAIEVTLAGLEAQKVELDISGVNMYMGYNRVVLGSSEAGHFSGTSMLAFCTQEKMQWQLTVMIHLPDGTQTQVPFLLDIHAP